MASFGDIENMSSHVCTSHTFVARSGEEKPSDDEEDGEEEVGLSYLNRNLDVCIMLMKDCEI